jgi:D-3-phosphoglycerate dehydrogenase
MNTDDLKVLVTDYPWRDLELEKEEFSKVGIQLMPSNFQCVTEEDVIREAQGLDAVLVCRAMVGRKAVESLLPKLKVIARYGTGVDSIDVEAATEHKIFVTINPGYCAEEVSNQALSFILCLARRIYFYNTSVKSGLWDYTVYAPIEGIRNLTLGLIGFGSIGQALARKAHAVGFKKILVYSPHVPERIFRECGVVSAQLAELLKESDIVSVHTAHTKETEHLMDEKAFRMMKETAYFINTSRGPIMSEKALCQALQNKWIAGAAVDVLEKEPPDHDNPLFSFDNLILAPHSGWYSEESIKENKRQTVTNVIRVLQGKDPIAAVNMDEVKKLKG